MLERGGERPEDEQRCVGLDIDYATVHDDDSRARVQAGGGVGGDDQGLGTSHPQSVPASCAVATTGCLLLARLLLVAKAPLKLQGHSQGDPQPMQLLHAGECQDLRLQQLLIAG